MKIALYDDYRPGLVVGDRLVDLVDVVGHKIMNELPRDRIPEIIANFDALRGAIAAVEASDGVPVASVRLRAPLPRPNKMLFGLGNYQEFIKTANKPFNAFVKSSRAVCDPGGTVVLIPHDPFIFHHEGEFAVVIGKFGRNILAEDALEYVFGYTAVVDVSARGFMGFVNFINKSPDNFCPMGPWITTADEIPDPQDLGVKLWVDGELRQDYRTSDMENPVREIIASVSRVLPLKPGDLLSCGVNHQGLGPLQDGETCEIEIERIGRLEFRVNDPKRRRWAKGIDKRMAAGVLNYRRGEPLPPPAEMFADRIA